MRWCTGVVLAASLLAATMSLTPANEAVAGDTRVDIGFRIAPVPLNYPAWARNDVGRGSYWVNAVGGCNDCHSSQPYTANGNPYEGKKTKVNAAKYLAGGGVFGPFVSPNLTPDRNGLPAGLTLKKFISTIRTGKDPDGSNRILQVMPWPIYANMSDSDLTDIYRYLRAIPSLPGNR
ncbi:MAG: hypothetical protein U1E45_17010 [Geminicoccaceae bacterium]